MSDDIVFNQLFSEFLEKLIDNQETTKELLAELLYRDIIDKEEEKIQRGIPDKTSQPTQTIEKDKPINVSVDTSNITKFLHDFLQKQNLDSDNLQPYFEKLIETIRQNIKSKVFLKDTSIPILKNILDTQHKHTALISSQNKDNLNLFTDLFEYSHTRTVEENNRMLIKLLDTAKQSYKKKNSFDVREDTPKQTSKTNIPKQLERFTPNLQPPNKPSEVIINVENFVEKDKSNYNTSNVREDTPKQTPKTNIPKQLERFIPTPRSYNKSPEVIIDVEDFVEKERNNYNGFKGLFEKMYNFLSKIPFTALAQIPFLVNSQDKETKSKTEFKPFNKTEDKASESNFKPFTKTEDRPPESNFQPFTVSEQQTNNTKQQTSTTPVENTSQYNRSYRQKIQRQRTQKFSDIRRRRKYNNSTRSIMRALRRSPVFKLLNKTLNMLNKVFEPLIKLLGILEPLKKFLQLGVIIAFPLIVKFIKDLPTYIEELKQKIYSIIPEESFKQWVVEMKDGFEVFKTVMNRVGDFLETTVIGSFNLAIKAFNILNERVQWAGETIGEFIGEIQSGSILNAFKGLVTNITDLFKENFKVVITSIVSFIAGIMEKIPGLKEEAQALKQKTVERPKKQVYQQAGNIKIYKDPEAQTPGIYKIENIETGETTTTSKRNAEKALKEQKEQMEQLNKNVKELIKVQEENNRILKDKDLSIQISSPPSRGSLISNMPRMESR